jgi:chromosome segregation ATPase
MNEDLTRKLPASADEKLTLILSRIETLEQTVAERLYDTRPIWQNVLTEILQLQQGQSQLQQGQSQLQQGQSQLQRSQDLLTAEVRSVRRDIDGRFGVIYGLLSEIQVDQRDLHARLTHVELNTHPPKPQT